MDAGCEYHGYVSDVTRTWPVEGKFTPVQKDLYEVVRLTKKDVIEVNLDRYLFRILLLFYSPPPDV